MFGIFRWKKKLKLKYKTTKIGEGSNDLHELLGPKKKNAEVPQAFLLPTCRFETGGVLSGVWWWICGSVEDKNKIDFHVLWKEKRPCMLNLALLKWVNM